jgi:hypothetical protein
MPTKPLTKEQEKKIEEDEKEEAEDEKFWQEQNEIYYLEHPEQKPTEESAPVDPDEEYRKAKMRVLSKIEGQVDLEDFWREVLSYPLWKDVLRTYYRIVAGVVQNHYASFTVSATVKNGFIEWTYRFFDADGKEIFYDATNEAGVKE